MKYSAGIISQSFWFVEFRKIIKLLDEGKTAKEIKEECIKKNFFGAFSERRAKSMYGAIWKRIKNTDTNLQKIFLNSDLSTQKIINLVAIMKSDVLFFEFIYDVYRGNIIVGKNTIELSDIKIFFKNKESQCEKISQFTELTIKRLSSTYMTFMLEADLIKNYNNKKNITPPIFDILLERYLIDSGDKIIVKAIKGEI